MKTKFAICSLVVTAFAFATFAAAEDPLRSWNDAAPKKIIIDFVQRVTKEGSADFVKPEERIATFDNDVSGGGVEFMRCFAEQTYGIPPQQVVGSGSKMKYEIRDGNPLLLRLPEVHSALSPDCNNYRIVIRRNAEVASA